MPRSISLSDSTVSAARHPLEPASRRYGSRPNRRVTRWVLAALMVALLVAATACQTQQDQRDFETQAIGPPSGITETNIHGMIPEGRVDPDDWRTSPFYEGVITMEPARPNPALSSEEVAIELYMDLDTRVQQIRVVVLRETGETPILDEVSGSPLAPGRHELRFPASSLSRDTSPQGLFRVLIYDGNWQIISYGDIQVE